MRIVINRGLSRVLGFVVLLVAIFTLAYAVGSWVGPVAPGIHPDSGSSEEQPADGEHGAGH